MNMNRVDFVVVTEQWVAVGLRPEERNCRAHSAFVDAWMWLVGSVHLVARCIELFVSVLSVILLYDLLQTVKQLEW